ncbi:MAG: mechanosensitive ion channel [Sumerlaeia bacterium]
MEDEVTTLTLQTAYPVARAWIVANGATFLANMLSALAILLIGAILIRTLLGVMRRAADKSDRFSPMLENFTISIAGKGLWVLLWILVLGQAGVHVAPLVASVGVLGFVIGFAFQESLGNLAAGFMILLNNPFQNGHVVDAAGYTGIVVDIDLSATTLKTFDGRRVVIPNGKVWGAPIVNYTVNGSRRAEFSVGVSYSADIAKAIAVLKEMVENDERVMKDPAPQVVVTGLADSSVNLAIRVWTVNDNFGPIMSETLQAIKARLDAEGIEIPYPQLVVNKGDWDAA